MHNMDKINQRGVMGKVIGCVIVVVVVHKKSPDLEILGNWATQEYNESVKVGENWLEDA